MADFHNEPATLEEKNQLIKQEIVEGVTHFTSSISKLLYEQARQGGNVLFSPINIYSALALVHLGTDGKSRDEIADLMKLPKENDKLQEAHKLLGETLKAIKDTTETDVHDEDGWHKRKTTNIQIANGIFVEKDLKLVPSYSSQAQLHYSSDVFNVDFSNDSNKATDIINEFVSKSTNQRIPRLLNNPVSPNTRIILASCLYFKANWDHEFSKRNTTDATFNTGSSEIVVKMMSTRKNVPYVDLSELQLEAISLKYSGGDVSMFFVLPKLNQPLDKLISTLTADTLKQVINKVEPTYVDYKIPRMKFKWSEDINGQLEQLGIKEIFSDNANLNNMVTGNELRVSKITHAAEIEIDEKGTEASAVTAVHITKRCAIMYPDPIDFHLDRPFLLFIYHHKTETILFFAAVHNPNVV